jgi:hypothetical protein
MDLFRNTLEPSYFKKVGDNLVYPSVFGYATPVFVLDPSVWSPANGQITSKTQLDSEKTEFSGDLTVLASSFQDSVWTNNGWDLENLSDDLQNFYDSNLIFEESSNIDDNHGMNYILVKKNIDGVDYTVVVLYVGSYTNDVTWEILMATSGYKPQTTYYTALGSPGSSTFETITASSTSADNRNYIGDGFGLYNGFFVKKNITKIALVDGSSSSLNPTSHTNYLIYDLVESTGEEAIYDILLRLNNYQKNNASFSRDDSVFGDPSVLNFTAGLNGYSGTLSTSGGTSFKSNDGTTPEKFVFMGINRDSDNDIQALCSFSGNLNLGKGDSWRNENPSQTFWSYWGHDFHSDSRTQRIGYSKQTSPGIATGVTYSGNVYLLAF